MADNERAKTVSELVTAVDQQLIRFDTQRIDLTLREKVQCLVRAYRDLRAVGVAMVVQEHDFDATSAQKRILAYLLEYPGTAIEGAELEIVSGISEYARRVRELRKEQGFQIASGASPDPDSGIDLAPSQYLLVSTTPDVDAAARWHIANRIRKDPASTQQRILMYVSENVGSVVTTEELAYVARDAREFGRRARELRTEHGYPLATRFTGRPDLGAGQYILESLDRIAEPHDRRIPERVQKEVYERDGNACRACQWSRGAHNPTDPRILELHHLTHHAHGGKNVAGNLIVICSKCHDEVHAGTRNLPMSEG